MTERLGSTFPSRAAAPLLIAAAAVLLCVPCGRPSGAPGRGDWKANLRKLHTRFTGRKGTFAQFGDSITFTQAYWSPLLGAHRNAPPEMERAFQKVKAYLRPECWRDWKGPEYGSESARTLTWAGEHIDEWLKRLNPEAVQIMFGTNDLAQMGVDEFRLRLRSVVRKCLGNGTAVLLSTPPPRHGSEEKAARFAEAVREVAREMEVPLVDYHAEILKRRPDDWDGAREAFRAYEGYEVPTLLSRDGVHPSFPRKYQDDYSEDGLNRSGYTLRNYLVLMRYAEVLDALNTDPPTEKNEATPPGKGDGVFPLVPPRQSWFPKAPPLAVSSGEILHVSTVDDLYRAAERVRPGGTLLLADGVYRLPRPLDLRADGVTLRSASGRRERVILDGGGELGEGLRLFGCSGVTLAHLTVQNIRWNGIKVNSETGVQRATVYDCILHNIWQRAVKGVMVPKEGRDRLRPRDCRIRYCLFYNDRPKRFTDDPGDTAETFNGNYIGGIDVMAAGEWTISDNVFIGIQGRTGEARGAIFLWQDTRDCLIERNVIVDCDAGICLGNSHRGEPGQIHALRCTVRNNFVTRAPENGIFAAYTRNCKIFHNTVCDPNSPQGRLIRLVHDNDGLEAMNNLLCGPDIRIESDSRMTLRNNRRIMASSAFIDPASGNLHLSEKEKDSLLRVNRLKEVPRDIDDRPRGRQTDFGADEIGSDSKAK